MAGVTVRKRQLEWWREANEVPETGRLTEEYSQKGFKAGCDGKNSPSVLDYDYDKKGIDALGAGAGEHSKKGKSALPATKEVRKVVAKKVQEEEDFDFGDEEDPLGDEGSEMDADVNPDMDVPPEMDDEAMEDEGSEEVAQDVEITIAGKKYTLVPAEDEMGDEEMGAEGMDEPMEEPPMEDTEAVDNGGVAAEDDDVSQYESKKNAKKALKEEDSVDYDEVVDQGAPSPSPAMESAKRQKAIKDALVMKAKAEKALKELFTGVYVKNKGEQGKAGFDFSDVAGDKDFAVVARAASGEQYSPTDTKETRFEPATDTGAKSGAHEKHVEQIKKRMAFKKWLEKQSALVETDKDPGEDSEAFNKRPNNEPETGEVGWSDTPEKIGKDQKVITHSDTDSKAESKKVSDYAKYKRIQQERKLRKEAEAAKAVKISESEGLEESFNFKKLMADGYKSLKG